MKDNTEDLTAIYMLGKYDGRKEAEAEAAKEIQKIRDYDLLSFEYKNLIADVKGAIEFLEENEILDSLDREELLIILNSSID